MAGRVEDALLRQYVLKNLSSFHHALGTAPMGRNGDPNAVVDQYGKVRGFENLWLADASIMPAIPRVIPNLICMVIGTRIGHWLALRHAGLHANDRHAYVSGSS
ncbi:MAG: GMC family oxidoreductase [Microvirga sp.]